MFKNLIQIYLRCKIISWNANALLLRESEIEMSHTDILKSEVHQLLDYLFVW